MDEVCHIHRLSVSYTTAKGELKALRRVGFSIPKGKSWAWWEKAVAENPP